MAHLWHTPGLTEIEEQKHWELDGVERGVRRVRQEIDNQRVADSQLGSALAQHAVPRLIKELEAAQEEAKAGLANSAGQRGRVTPWWYMMLLLDADKLAVITVKKVMSFQPREFTFNPALTGLASDINGALKDQIDYEDWREQDRLAKAEAKARKAGEVEMKQLAAKSVDRFFETYKLTPRNLKRLRERMEKKREERWDTPTGVQFGVVLLQRLCAAVPEWFSIESLRLRQGRWEYQFVFSQAARDALFKISEQCELSQPALMPMICPPGDWRVAA